MSDYYPSAEAVMPLWAGLARRSDPPTAKAAGANARRFRRGHARLILEALAAGPGTKDELAARIATLNEQQVERRMHELRRDGLVVVVGEAVSPTGNRETVYAARAAGGSHGGHEQNVQQVQHDKGV